jgi:hypothetical protein
MENIEDAPLTIHDLRPYLGRINWQLRRLNTGLVVTVDENEHVKSVCLADSQNWIITCDQCANEYESVQRIPICPQCGFAEANEPE